MPPSEVGGDALLCASVPCESDQCESVSRGSYLDSVGQGLDPGSLWHTRMTVAEGPALPPPSCSSTCIL